jgi:azurin
VFGFIPAKMQTIQALVKNGVCAPDTDLLPPDDVLVRAFVAVFAFSPDAFDAL